MDGDMDRQTKAAGNREGKVGLKVALPGPGAQALAARERIAGGPEFGVLDTGNAAPPGARHPK